MSIELKLLAWSVILLFVHLFLQAGLATSARGVAWNAGPRDESSPLPTNAGRAQRAFDNFKETWPAYIALALALAVTGRTGGTGALGAWIWFIARLVYIPLYLMGIPGVRTLVWGVSAAGLILMLARLW
ncbi:MAG: MAPEG family protein [Caulobacteraceae bacterium]|nr:MAPEG family protein [Caulobacteraceae bacterium]